MHLQAAICEPFHTARLIRFRRFLPVKRRCIDQYPVISPSGLAKQSRYVVALCTTGKVDSRHLGLAKKRGGFPDIPDYENM